MKVRLNVTCSIQKDIPTKSPIFGEVTIDKGVGVKNGTFTTTFSEIDTDDIKGGAKIMPQSGDTRPVTCMQYGAGATGAGVVIQKTIARDGGSSGSPYIQKITTILGASSGN